MKKNILVINGNPKSNSFCDILTDTYTASCPETHDVKCIRLHQLNFNIDLTEGYNQTQALEPDLLDFQQTLQWANHVVFILPVWWGGLPAKLKGLFDRTFLPDFAFKYHNAKSFPEKLLQGKTSHIILTLDTPPFFYRWFQGNPVQKQLKRTILEFCGIQVIATTYIGSIVNSTDAQRKKWLNKVSLIASQT